MWKNKQRKKINNWCLKLCCIFGIPVVCNILLFAIAIVEDQHALAQIRELAKEKDSTLNSKSIIIAFAIVVMENALSIAWFELFLETINTNYRKDAILLNIDNLIKKHLKDNNMNINSNDVSFSGSMAFANASHKNINSRSRSIGNGSDSRLLSTSKSTSQQQNQQIHSSAKIGTYKISSQYGATDESDNNQ